MKASSTHFVYKEVLVKEMNHFVDAFYSKLSRKIDLITNKKKNELREMNELKNDRQQAAQLWKSSKEKANLPGGKYIKRAGVAYLPDDSPQQPIHCNTAQSILSQQKEGCQSQILSSMYQADDAISVDSACVSMTSPDNCSLHLSDINTTL